jgi:hypothetical protein
MSRSTKSSRGLTYYISYLFLLIVFVGVVFFGAAYIIDLFLSTFVHYAKVGCPKGQNIIEASYHKITLWNMFIVALIVFVFFKLREHL